MPLEVIFRCKALRPGAARLATPIGLRVLQIMLPKSRNQQHVPVENEEAYTDCASDGFLSSLPQEVHGGTDDLPDFVGLRWSTCMISLC